MKTPSVITADMNEILFEGRNKAYGAYQLRQNSNRYLSRAALVVLLLFLMGTTVPQMASWFVSPFITQAEAPREEVVMVDLSEILDKKEEEKQEVPPPTPEPPKPPVATSSYRVPIPDPEAKMDPTITEIEKLDSSQIAKDTQRGIKDGPIDWEALERKGGGGGLGSFELEKEIDHDEFVDLEIEPKPVNMEEFVKKVGYPEMAKEGGIDGKVMVRIQVDKFGNYNKYVIYRDPHPILTNAVVSNLKMLRFTPGIQAGKPVKCWVTLPVIFEIE